MLTSMKKEHADFNKEEFMDFQEAQIYIRSIQTGAKIKPGLETIGHLLAFLGNPQDSLTFVHIAGTNGKGSTASFIASVLAETGMKVGRYVSPAVFSELEKIRWMKRNEISYITEEEFASVLTEVIEAVDKMKEHGFNVPTEFEIETAAAFVAFARWDCDVVVLEAGMGGRLDATNIVKNVVCSVITPIAMDHMQFLGNTVEQIAFEKAGIIKKHVPVASFQKEEAASRCLDRVCRERETEIRYVDQEKIKIIKTTREGSTFDYKGHKGLQIALAGLYQIQNACLAINCLEILKENYDITDEVIRTGLLHTVWQGRFEQICENPAVIIDGAHNPDGMRVFCESVRAYYGDYRKIGIMGVFADKDYHQMAEMLRGVFDLIYTIKPPTERGLPAEQLAQVLRDRGMSAQACASMGDALRCAGGEMVYDEKKAIFIFGSLSLMECAYQEVKNII